MEISTITKAGINQFDIVNKYKNGLLNFIRRLRHAQADIKNLVNY